MLVADKQLWEALSVRPSVHPSVRGSEMIECCSCLFVCVWGGVEDGADGGSARLPPCPTVGNDTVTPVTCLLLYWLRHNRHLYRHCSYSCFLLMLFLLFLIVSNKCFLPFIVPIIGLILRIGACYKKLWIFLWTKCLNWRMHLNFSRLNFPPCCRLPVSRSIILYQFDSREEQLRGGGRRR